MKNNYLVGKNITLPSTFLIVILCLHFPHVQISQNIKSAVPVIIMTQIVIAVTQMQDVAAFDKLTAGADLTTIDFFKAPKNDFANTNSCSIVAKIRYNRDIDVSMSKIIMR